MAYSRSFSIVEGPILIRGFRGGGPSGSERDCSQTLGRPQEPRAWASERMRHVEGGDWQAVARPLRSATTKEAGDGPQQGESKSRLRLRGAGCPERRPALEIDRPRSSDRCSRRRDTSAHRVRGRHGLAGGPEAAIGASARRDPQRGGLPPAPACVSCTAGGRSPAARSGRSRGRRWNSRDRGHPVTIASYASRTFFRDSSSAAAKASKSG